MATVGSLGVPRAGGRPGCGFRGHSARYSTRPPWHRAAAFLRMANIHSQKKRILRSERERLENRRYTSTIKTYFRRLAAAVDAGDATTADAEHKHLVKVIDKAVKAGALHRNTGARKKSRAARVRAGAPSA